MKSNELKICEYCRTPRSKIQFRTCPFGAVCNPCGLHWNKCVDRLNTVSRAKHFFDWKLKNKMHLDRRMVYVDDFERLFPDEEEQSKVKEPEDEEHKEEDIEVLNAARILMNMRNHC